jgi:hypothetical protein
VNKTNKNAFFFFNTNRYQDGTDAHWRPQTDIRTVSNDQYYHKHVAVTHGIVDVVPGKRGRKPGTKNKPGHKAGGVRYTGTTVEAKTGKTAAQLQEEKQVAAMELKRKRLEAELMSIDLENERGGNSLQPPPVKKLAVQGHGSHVGNIARFNYELRCRQTGVCNV